MQGVKYDGKGPALEEIDALYRSILGRDADSSGLDAYDKSNGDINYIRQSLRSSDEFLGKNPEAKEFSDFVKRTQQNRGVAEGDRQFLLNSIRRGEDLSSLYSSGTYSDAVALMNDLGLYRGKDESMIIPANPVGYSGGFKFDPVFGSSFYKDLAMQVGQAMGLSEDQIRSTAGQLAVENWYNGGQTKNIMGFSDYGKILTDRLAQTAGVSAEKLAPVYDTIAQVDSKFRQAGAVESQSSGTFKQIGADIAKLGPIGTIALTAALGPAGAGLSAVGAAATAAALPSALQGDFSGALKSGALAGLSAGVLKGLDGTISKAVGGGIPGDIVGGAAKGALTGGASAVLGGGDIKDGLIRGAIGGGAVAGVTSGVNALTGPANPVVGGIDDSNNDLGRSVGFLEGYGGTPEVGGIDDSRNDVGASVDRLGNYNDNLGVGGIDDSNNDLGRTVPSLVGSVPTTSRTGLGNVVGPVVGGLIAKEILGPGNNQPVGSISAPAQVFQPSPMTGGSGVAAPLPRGSFSAGAPASSGSSQAARINLQSLFGDSLFAQQNQYLRSVL